MIQRLFASGLLLGMAAAGTMAPHLPTVKSGGIGVWSAAASLITGRSEQTATLMRNGTVLVAGGTDDLGNALASAEVYNPRTNRWTRAGTMMTARIEFTATLLLSGEVLVVGGLVALPPRSSPMVSAELFDPTTNSWLPTAPMNVGRFRHTATGLPDGRVLVVGGDGFTAGDGVSPNPPGSAEIYDPTTNHWSATAPMSRVRIGHTATLLGDGRVLVISGADLSSTLRSAEIYDPKRDRWSAAASMAIDRIGHTATLLSNGNVLVVGGWDSSNTPLSSAEMYDPRADRWSTVASMAGPRIRHAATLLRNRSVLVVGDISPSRPVEVYDAARNRWSAVSRPMYRFSQTATSLPDGRVLVVGGSLSNSLSSVLLYDPNATAPRPGEPINV